MKTKAKVGDTILMTHPTDRLDMWCKFVVETVRDGRLPSITRFTYGDGYALYLENNAFKVIEPSDTLAKPGDKIIVTNPRLSGWLRQEFVVVCPPGKTDYDPLDRTWVCLDNKEPHWLYRNSFEIMKRSTPAALVSYSDCKGTGTIELFTSTAKCRCRYITVEQE